MPCIVGPYTSVNATLRLIQNRYRVNPDTTDGYAEQSAGSKTDQRFRTSNVPIPAIAVSTAQTDAGVFELDFKGERFLPFEGAGCISRWTLQLPTVRQFDYNSLTDVIVQLKYTAVDGGSSLQDPASQFVKSVLQAASMSMAEMGLSVLYDVRTDFAMEWSKAINAGAGTKGGVATTVGLTGLDRRLRVYTPGFSVGLKEVDMLTDAPSPPTVVEIKTNPDGTNVDGKTFAFGAPSNVGGLNLYTGSGAGISLVHWEIRANSKDLAAVKKLWLLVKYNLTPTS
jgi:receptor-binding and translocation channel-forming TcA subunit of Tc toxin